MLCGSAHVSKLLASCRVLRSTALPKPPLRPAGPILHVIRLHPRQCTCGSARSGSALEADVKPICPCELQPVGAAQCPVLTTPQLFQLYHPWSFGRMKRLLSRAMPARWSSSASVASVCRAVLLFWLSSIVLEYGGGHYAAWHDPVAMGRKAGQAHRTDMPTRHGILSTSRGGNYNCRRVPRLRMPSTRYPCLSVHTCVQR